MYLLSLCKYSGNRLMGSNRSAAQDLEQYHISSFRETACNELVLKSRESHSVADLFCEKVALQSGCSSLYLS